MGFGLKLKELLKRKGITIKELSVMTGISINTLYSITKRDTKAPEKEIIKKIANALKINESELYTFEMIDSELRQLIDQQKKAEEDFRSSLLELCKMLNSNGTGELIKHALELIRYEAYWSPFYNQNAIKSFVGDKIIPLDPDMPEK